MSTTTAIAHTFDQASRAALRKKADAIRWFHAIDFGDFQTRGRFPAHLPPNSTLYPVFELLSRVEIGGLRCLDIGTYSGLVAHGLAKLGAASVAATDIQDRPEFRLTSELLGIEIDYRPDVLIDGLEGAFEAESFDLIICAGVLYHMLDHMLDPVRAFSECRKLLRPGGLLILETAFHAGLEGPTMFLNSEDDQYIEPTTYWLPSRGAVEGMARLCCFDVLQTIELAHTRPQYARLAVACRACGPDEIGDRRPNLVRIHERGVKGLGYKPASLTSAGAGEAISYTGERGHTVMRAEAYTPSFPLHAHTLRDPVGLTS